MRCRNNPGAAIAAIKENICNIYPLWFYSMGFTYKISSTLVTETSIFVMVASLALKDAIEKKYFLVLGILWLSSALNKIKFYLKIIDVIFTHLQASLSSIQLQGWGFF